MVPPTRRADRGPLSLLDQPPQPAVGSSGRPVDREVAAGAAGRRYLATGLMLGLGLVAAAGCGRGFYRRQADCEAYALVDRASDDPRWPLEGFTIEPDPQSRMFDPFCYDYPPMPPDDPTAHRLMQCVDCKRGWPCWHANGDTPYVENPDWMAYLPSDEHGEVVLDRPGAVKTALLHSREYQQELENVYLSALDVTLQRFRFDTQFFGGNSTTFDAQGRLAGGRSLLSTDTDLQMRKLYATGGDLLVGVANSLVWQFAGPDTYSANTLLDFSLVQPLLRAGGRAVVLESLTAAERGLLADIRALERYRRSFYVRTAADYLGLLEEQVRIRNQEGNVTRLRQSTARLESFFEGGGAVRGDVDRTRQSLYESQSRLLSLNATYEGRLDSYKIALGLPPQLAVRAEDPLLATFDLIAPAITTTRDEVDELLQKLRPLQRAGEIVPEDYQEALASIGQDAAAHVQLVENDMQRLARALPERRESLRLLVQREEFKRGEIDPSIGDVGALESRVAALEQDFAAVVGKLNGVLQALKSFEAVSSEAAAETGAGVDEAGERLVELVDEMSQDLLELSLVQAQARLDAVTMVPVDLDPEEALEIARENRRDWMDARAALVDSWRQIEIRANDLQSGLDVTFSGDINTTDNNPVQFRSATGRLRVGLEFDAPLTRLAERNAYRRALIDYQRARRNYYAFEDRISQELRSRLRNVRLNQLDFEIQRAAVLVAIARVDESGRNLRKPPKELGGRAQVGESFVERLLSDFAALLAAQNQFLSVWVDQEIERMNLDLDLGTMQLDAQGLWVDPGPMEMPTQGEAEEADEAPLPPDGPETIPTPPVEPI